MLIFTTNLHAFDDDQRTADASNCSVICTTSDTFKSNKQDKWGATKVNREESRTQPGLQDIVTINCFQMSLCSQIGAEAVNSRHLGTGTPTLEMAVKEVAPHVHETSKSF